MKLSQKERWRSGRVSPEVSALGVRGKNKPFALITYLDGRDEEAAEETARFLAQAPALSALLIEALQAWAEQFDGPQDEDLNLSGADLIEWFTAWRLRAREALKAAGVEA